VEGCPPTTEIAFASGHHDLLEPSASRHSSAIWGASRLPLLGLAGHLQFAVTSGRTLAPGYQWATLAWPCGLSWFPRDASGQNLVQHQRAPHCFLVSCGLIHVWPCRPSWCWLSCQQVDS